jgi:hypothetical protein
MSRAVPPDFLFVVGMPRTGTELARQILNRSDDVSLGSESHFFVDPFRIRFWANRSFRDRIAKVGDPASDEGVARIVDYVYALPPGTFWGWIAANVEREAFREALLASDRSDRAILEIALLFHGQGRRICGEKTPDNVYAVPQLLDWFPGAKVIHTFRDPRAAFVSHKRKRQNLDIWYRGARTPGLGLLIDLYASMRMIVSWHRNVRLHRRYEQRYPGQYLMVRFEDLITRPATVVRQECRFLGIDYNPGMLDQSTINSSFRRREEVQGFDRTALRRWRKELHPVVRWWFSLWCRGSMREFGYGGDVLTPVRGRTARAARSG